MRNTEFDPLDRAALRMWQDSGAGDNSERIRRLVTVLPLAVERELTPRQREILKMRFEDGKRPCEIADELGISRSAVSRSLARSVNRLFRVLQYNL